MVEYLMGAGYQQAGRVRTSGKICLELEFSHPRRSCVMIPNDGLQNRYSLVKGAARRARQLQSGAPALGVSKSLKACRVAQDEVRAGKVTFVLPGLKTAPPTDV